MKKGSIKWPDGFIQPTENARTKECCCFTLHNAFGERLPEYPGLYCQEPTDKEMEEDEHEMGPEYKYTYYAADIKTEMVAMIGFMMQEMINRLDNPGGDDDYFDYMPGYIAAFEELHTLLQAHDLWNIFREQALKTKAVTEDPTLWKEIKWCLPEELPEPE